MKQTSLHHRLMAIAFAPPYYGREIWKRVVAQARAETRKLQNRIEAATLKGEMERASKLQRTLLSSLAAKVVAVNEAARGAPASTEPLALVRRAFALNCFQRCDERAVAKPRLKPTGGQRWIYSFGFENRARQHMVRLALEPFRSVSLDPRQKTLPVAGRRAGTHVCMTEIADAARSYKWGAQLDITNFFPSITPELLGIERGGTRTNNNTRGEELVRKLPLPRAVIQNVVLADNLNHVIRPATNHGHPYGDCLGEITATVEARRGIPQGSCCSSIVAEFVIAGVLSGIRDVPGFKLVTFADNLFVLAQTKVELDMHVRTLQAAFIRYSSGMLSLHAKVLSARLCDGLNGLGYRVQRLKGRVSLQPAKGHFEKLRKTLMPFIKDVRKGRIIRVVEVTGAILKWANHFKATSGDAIELALRRFRRWIDQLFLPHEIQFNEPCQRSASGLVDTVIRLLRPNLSASLRFRDLVSPRGLTGF